MKLIIGILSIFIFLMSCSPENKNSSQKISETLSTNFGKIDDKNLNLKFGDLVIFEIYNQKINAIILDIKLEENEYWFGLCFIKNNQLFGRRIPQGFGGECIELFDITYLNEKGLNNFKLINNLEINYDKVGIGSDSPVINYDEILRDYERGLENRKKSETPCKEKLKMLDPINERYIGIDKIRNVT